MLVTTKPTATNSALMVRAILKFKQKKLAGNPNERRKSSSLVFLQITIHLPTSIYKSMPGYRLFTSSPRKSKNSKHGGPSPVKPFAPKKSWDVYLSDANKYKLSEEEMMRRKESIISSNNILQSPRKSPQPKSKVNMRKDGTVSSPKKSIESQFDYRSPTATIKPAKQHLSLRYRERPVRALSSDCNDPEDDFDVDLHHLSYVSDSPSPSHDDLKKSKVVSKRGTKQPNAVSPTRKVADEDENLFQEISLQIQALLGELRSYEQLSGRRSCFDVVELEATFAEQFALTKGPSRTTLVLKFLTQLVSQSMTYLLQSQIQIQSQKILNDSLTAQINCLEKSADVASIPVSDNTKQKPQQTELSPLSTDMSTPNQVEVESTMNHKDNLGQSPVTDIESPHVSNLKDVNKLVINTPEMSTQRSKVSSWTPVARHEDLCASVTPNGTSASDWLFAQPVTSDTSSKMLASLTPSLLQQSPSSVTNPRFDPAQTKRNLFSPSPGEKVPAVSERRNRYAADLDYNEIENHTPANTYLESSRNIDETDRSRSAYHNFIQSKPLIKSPPKTSLLNQETTSMIVPRAVIPTPYAPSKFVHKTPAVQRDHDQSLSQYQQTVRTRLFDSAK